MAGLGLAVLFLTVLIGYRALYQGKIYPGVNVASVPVGGLTPEQAQITLRAHLESSIQNPLVVTADGQQWQLSREALGAHYDWPGLAAAAYDVGRTGSAFDQLTAPVLVRVASRNVEASVELKPTDWSAILAPIAKQIDRPAVDATLAVSPDHTVQLKPDRSGVHLDEEAAKRVIANALASGATTPIQLPIIPIPPAVSAAALQADRAQAMTYLSGPVTLTYEGRTWTLDVDQLQAALTASSLDSSGKPSKLDVNQSLLDRFVGQVAADVNRPVRDAELTLQAGKVTVVPEQSGRRVDVEATENLVRKALATNERTLSPVIQEVAPKVTAAEWDSVVVLANRLIGSPVVLSGPGNQSWELSTASLQKMLVLPKQPGDSGTSQPQLDSTKLSTFVASVAKDVDRDPVNARFQLAGGKATLLKPGVDGLRVDQAATVTAIQVAATGSTRMVSLPVASVAPAIGADEASKLAGLQLIADNSTSYAGSIPPRRHNVELATSLLNGVVVPPGRVF
jgi:vancomycin resistance protein YoaR